MVLLRQILACRASGVLDQSVVFYCGFEAGIDNLVRLT
jgi:hypothetical protein